MFYVMRSGILPWGMPALASTIVDRKTLTIVSSNYETLGRFLNKIFTIIGEHYPTLFKWYTVAQPFEGNKLQFKKLIDELSQPRPGFANTFVDSSITPSSASLLVLPFSKKHLEYLSYPYRTLLIMPRNEIAYPLEICMALQSYNRWLDLRTLESIAMTHDNWMLGRCHDDNCTYCAWDFIGPIEYINEVIEIVDGLGLTHLTSQREIAQAISSMHISGGD